MSTPVRRLPGGAELVPGGAHFRVWAPEHFSVEVISPGSVTPLRREESGHFSGFVEGVGAGTRYRYRIDGGASFPDPYSRFQPDGPHHDSAIVDSDSFTWTDDGWPGLDGQREVIYELHIGTFTPEGTWRDAGEKLEYLRDLGITAVEVLPVSEFPGCFGWGYDGVHPFAPTRLYGTPGDFRAFVDRAHALGLGVILDVVYNHLGPDGNYFGEFSKRYFTSRHHTAWGAAIDYSHREVREFAVSNAAYWIREFHLDGLRLDATTDIHDDSPDHVIAELARAARSAANGRGIAIIAENYLRDTTLIRPEERGGRGLDMIWNEDFHRAALVAATGTREAYLAAFHGRPQEFVSLAKYGCLYHGQWNRWYRGRLGKPASGAPPCAFVNFLENHDQVSNTPRASRFWQMTDAATYRALTALWLLAPGTPMFFQGQEFRSSVGFPFFADHDGELASAVFKGRARYLARQRRFSTAAMQKLIPDPADPRTFASAKLDWAEVERHAECLAMVRDLLLLRREDPAIAAADVDGAVIGDHAFVLRYFSDAGDRLLIVNLGADLHLEPVSEPLLASPVEWKLLWSSEQPEYGGSGALQPESGRGWRIQARSTSLVG